MHGHIDLREDVYRAHPTAEVNSMTDQQLIEAVKSLAVKVESKLIPRIRIGEAAQPPGTGVRNFLATLKPRPSCVSSRSTVPSAPQISTTASRSYRTSL